MDKQDTISNYNHGISLLERKNLVITGVKKIENFDSNEFLLDTLQGFLSIKGEGFRYYARKCYDKGNGLWN